jgi:acyl-CoA thioester hydrolase
LSEDLLAGFPVAIRIPVQWGEMDAYGHVNNTVFFRYFESARIEFLDRCRFLEAYEREKVGAILHSTSCRFRRPLFYPDTALIGTRASQVDDDRFTMEYVIASESENAVIAEGTGIVVSFDYVNRAVVPIPDYVREAIDEMGD